MLDANKITDETGLLPVLTSRNGRKAVTWHVTLDVGNTLCGRYKVPAIYGRMPELVHNAPTAKTTCGVCVMVRDR